MKDDMLSLGEGSEQGSTGGLGALGAGRTLEFQDTGSGGCSEKTVWPTCQDSVQSFRTMIFENTNIAGTD